MNDTDATNRPPHRLFEQLGRSLPNLLSAARLFLALAFPFLPRTYWVPVALAAGLSDLVDGALSRRLHATSVTGRVLDPIADKMFVASVLGTLIVQDILLWWQVLWVGARDIAVLLGAVWVALRGGWSSVRSLEPTLLGKITTAAQFLFLLSVLYASGVSQPILIVTGVLSVLAALDYLRPRPQLQPNSR